MENTGDGLCSRFLLYFQQLLLYYPGLISMFLPDRLTKLQILAPWASVVGHAVKIHALAMSSAQILPTRPSSVHYLWSFGDEVETLLSFEH